MYCCSVFSSYFILTPVARPSPRERSLGWKKFGRNSGGAVCLCSVGCVNPSVLCSPSSLHPTPPPKSIDNPIPGRHDDQHFFHFATLEFSTTPLSEKWALAIICGELSENVPVSVGTHPPTHLRSLFDLWTGLGGGGILCNMGGISCNTLC